MSKKTPFEIVKEKFGSKEELVHKLLDLVEPQEDESRDELASRLKHVANAKLLHLAEVGEKVKSMGGKEKLVEKVAELKGQIKDNDYIKKAQTFTMSRLVDLYESMSKTKKEG